MQAADGRFKHVRTGNARPQQAVPGGSGGLGDGPKALAAPGASASAGAILAVACPMVAYPQGTADLCATYGIASAVHEFGDASGAATIAACARAALKVSCRARTFISWLLPSRWPACERARSSPRGYTDAHILRSNASAAAAHLRALTDWVAGWEAASRKFPKRFMVSGFLF